MEPIIEMRRPDLTLVRLGGKGIEASEVDNQYEEYESSE